MTQGNPSAQILTDLQARVTYVRDRVAEAQATYDATRKHSAMHILRCARTALLVAETELMTHEQEIKLKWVDA